MNNMVITYIQFLIIGVFITKIKGEVYEIAKQDQPQLYRILECVTRCINNNNQSIESCYSQCTQEVEKLKENELQHPLKGYAYLELICRDSSKLVLRVLKNDSYQSTNTSTTLKTNEKQLYMVTVEDNGQTNTERHIYLSDSQVVTVENLGPNTLYNLTAIIFSANGHKVSTSMYQMKTLRENYQPENIRQLSLERIFKTSSMVNVNISWTPGDDKTCFYLIELLMLSQGSTVQIIKKDPLFPYKHTLYGLDIDEGYEVGVKALNSIDTTFESDFVKRSFNTSRCNAFHNVNLTICPPDEVSVLSATLTHLAQDRDAFALNITWEPPFTTPDNYTIKVESQTYSKNYSISGNKTEFYTELVLTEPREEIKFIVDALSRGGRSPGDIKKIIPGIPMTISPLDASMRKKEKEWKKENNDIPIEIIDLMRELQNSAEVKHPVNSLKVWHILILFMLGVGLVSLIIYKYRKNRKTDNSTQETFVMKEIAQGEAHGLHVIDTNDKEKSCFIDDEFEVCKDQIELFEILGEGAFGMVKKGRYNGEIVAVKTLKENTTECEIKDFRNEIELMKSVGKHRNIIGIVGHFTKDFKEMMLLTEYCGKGNLLDFLRNTWKELQYKKNNTTNTGQYISNKIYEEMQVKTIVKVDRDENMDQLSKCDNGLRCNGLLLLDFALQVACGMEYLSNDKKVHRDLAARNVLVCDDLTLKISDFGLSRDVYLRNYYRKTTAGKLPIKWLALESLERNIYTVYTDVWSYGILLYEIFTLGNMPYPSVPPKELLDVLRAGNRLEKPQNCSDAAYELMRNCWLEIPKQRPNFTEMIKILQELITETKTGKIEHVSF